VDFGGVGVDDDKAAVWMEVVNELIASSISDGDLRRVFRFICLSIVSSKFSQSIWPFVRDGGRGLMGGNVSIVSRTGEWSEQGSFKFVI